MITALALALSLMLADAPARQGEPLPPGAPTDSYQLSAWCYGALEEYLAVYDRVKPDLRDIDHMFGTSVVEADPYHSDMAAARVELKMIGDSVTDAEKASPRAIAEQGAAAVRQGQGIWSLAETKTNRELARAWMLWALPDRCDTNARELTQRSILFGKALNYNNTSSAAPQTGAAPAPQAEPAPQPALPAGPAPQPDQTPPPADVMATAPPSAEPSAQASPTTDTDVPATPATDAGSAPAAPAAVAPGEPAPSEPVPNEPVPSQPVSSEPAPIAPTPAVKDPAIPPYPIAQP